MLATLLSTENEEGGLAVISVNDVEINAMDCLGYGPPGVSYPKVGDRFVPEFSCLFDDDEKLDWNSVFGGNPDQLQKLEPTGLWSYRAFGKVALTESQNSNSEALADCGGVLIPMPIEILSDEYLGAFVAFNVVRLSVWCSRD